MAALRSSYDNRALYILGLFSLLLIQKGDAFEFKVGGSSGWSVPSDAQSYNQWAEKNRFQIGDTLLFEYSADKDSVLQVTKEHYTNCTTDHPLAKFTDGHTVFKFNQSGPFFFISGSKANCLNNQKIHVVVLADRTGTKSSPPPPPSPAPVPSGDEVPSPPAESIPSPAPTSDEGQTQAPPKNGASSTIAGMFGALLGFSVVLGF